jgi:putative transposase
MTIPCKNVDSATLRLTLALMPRRPRIVHPGMPHHVTQRGNRQGAIFFTDADRKAYLQLVASRCAGSGTRCLAWCLMDNHVHFILVPDHEDGLRAVIGPAHTSYSRRINLLHGWSGHVFQGRFASYAMADAHLMIAVRYVENNPVKAGLVTRADDWRWSSARSHLGWGDDGLTDIAAIGQHVTDWRAYLEVGVEASDGHPEIEAALLSGRLGQIGDSHRQVRR